MVNREKLVTQWVHKTKTKKKQKTKNKNKDKKQKNTTQYVFDTTIRKQTQIT